MQELLNFIPKWELIAFAGILGALWGSFANVVIVRWPQELSIVTPGSHCFSCGKPISWYDNIPVFSYLILRGRCRHCKTSFSPRYAIVELTMAIIAASLMKMVLPEKGPADTQSLIVFAIWFAFVLSLLIVAMIDLEHYLIPDVIVLPGIAAGILANTFYLRLGYIEPIVSAGIAYAGLRLLFIDGYRMLTGKQGMGAGDAKLLAMFGAFLGYEGTLFALFSAAFQGLIIGIIMVAFRRKDGMDNEPVFEEEQSDDLESTEPDTSMLKARVPFGPFLVLGAIEYLFAGEWFLAQYTNLVAKIVYGI